MKRISNPFTPALKILPFLVGGFSVFILALLLKSFMLALLPKNSVLQQAPMFVVFPCLAAIAGYCAWKDGIQDLLDEVYDCGDYLLIKKGGQEDTLPLSNINWVRFSNTRNGSQPRIQLILDAPGKFGTELLFVPPLNIQNLLTPRTNRVAEDLVARVNEARSARVR